MRYWMSVVPVKCDTCGIGIGHRFYDAATNYNSIWAIMCPSCHHFGPGRGLVGPGRGQEYTKQDDGRFAKTAG